MINCLAVGLGGCIGSVCRYLIGFLPINRDSIFPTCTLLINVIGAFLLGLIVTAATKEATISNRLILFLKIGICGGFTTFSTFAYETANLLTGSHPLMGITYAFLSSVLGVSAVLLGQLVLR